MLPKLNASVECPHDINRNALLLFNCQVLTLSVSDSNRDKNWSQLADTRISLKLRKDGHESGKGI